MSYILELAKGLDDQDKQILADAMRGYTDTWVENTRYKELSRIIGISEEANRLVIAEMDSMSLGKVLSMSVMIMPVGKITLTKRYW